MNDLKDLLAQNVEWAKSVKKENENFFLDLSKQQTPDYLWIGCSDSRVPASQIIGLPPGEVFVHRNIANVVVHSDINCLSVIQYAVDMLKVKHIIICGHYGCGGVKGSLEDIQHGFIDNWLEHIKDVARFNFDIMDKTSDDQKFDVLCELNVKEQVKNVCNTTTVTNSWKAGQNLSVHGLIYSIEDGLLKDLNVSANSK